MLDRLAASLSVTLPGRTKCATSAMCTPSSRLPCFTFLSHQRGWGQEGQTELRIINTNYVTLNSITQREKTWLKKQTKKHIASVKKITGIEFIQYSYLPTKSSFSVNQKPPTLVNVTNLKYNFSSYKTLALQKVRKPNLGIQLHCLT